MTIVGSDRQSLVDRHQRGGAAPTAPMPIDDVVALEARRQVVSDGMYRLADAEPGQGAACSRTGADRSKVPTIVPLCALPDRPRSGRTY